MFSLRQSAAELASGWRGICLVACTYVYFLIFAQFAFLRRLAELGVAGTHLKVVMAAMAAGGILCSLLAASTAIAGSPTLRLRIAFAACGVAACLTLLPLGLASSILVAFLIGAALGLLTVTLAAHLRTWIGSGDGLLAAGFGTGLAYFVCNLQSLFTATPQVQAVVAALLCLAGMLVASEGVPGTTRETPPVALSFGRILACFTALVWLDSAAFFIIQNTPALKAGSWEGAAHLRANGLLHLAAAIGSAWLLRRRGLFAVLSLAVLALAAACVLMRYPERILLGSLFYPVGVSLYSVALVAYPSLLAGADSVPVRARKAGLIYAVAGWFGSAMGIGMGQHLGYVPLGFVVLALGLVLGPQIVTTLRSHAREAAAVAVTLAVAWCIQRAIGAGPYAQTAVERGRQVYLSEGCIHCHSQYVRPRTADVLLWGPAQTVAELRAAQPPLIGNRRQGPDLSQVGGRRSPLWLRAHFYDPRQVSHASFMPSYAYLFAGSSRGDDLIAYLESLKSPRYAEHLQMEQAWHPAADRDTAPADGPELFASYCATCHLQGGATRQQWLKSFARIPPNLQTGPWLRVPASDTARQRALDLARIIKFGIPGTDMPGHEYLSDRDVAALAAWLAASTVQTASSTTIQGETR